MMKSNDIKTNNIVKQTDYKPVELGYISDDTRPILAYEAVIDFPLCADSHAHPRAQLIYASEGIMRVMTDRGVWVVPPLQAVWIPSGVAHKVDFPVRVVLKNLFFDISCLSSMPAGCFVLSVSPLLRELINCFCSVTDDKRAENISRVIMDEIACADSVPLELPSSADDSVSAVIAVLINDPADRRTVAEWAKEANMSERNFARKFLKETGMNFGEWRRRLKIIKAVEMLSGGMPVTEISYDLGYQSLSAFIESFRKETGFSPSKYLK